VQALRAKMEGIRAFFVAGRRKADPSAALRDDNQKCKCNGKCNGKKQIQKAKGKIQKAKGKRQKANADPPSAAKDDNQKSRSKA
jgi:hypothetical protein